MFLAKRGDLSGYYPLTGDSAVLSERIFAFCVAAFFAFVAWAVKGMPPFVAWIGAACALVISGLTFTPINPRLILPAGCVAAAVVCLIAASTWLYQRYDEGSFANPETIAELTNLGWTVKPGKDDFLFEIQGASLPPMKESADYFSQLHKPFRIHLAQLTNINGLHFLSAVPGCTDIEINAGEFTDLSELQNITQLTSLIITQVPLTGSGTVDPSPLSSLTNLETLNLGSTRIRTVDFLTSFEKLRSLYLGQTLVSDLSPLAGNDSIESLTLRDTRITDLTPLAHDQHLVDLTIGGEQVPGLPVLGHLPNFKGLTVIEQRPFDLSPLGALTNLESVSILGAPQFDLSAFRNLSGLKTLSLSGLAFERPLSSVINIGAIGGLESLTTLALGQLQINDLSFLEGLKNLRELGINQLPIGSIAPLRRLKSLKKITLFDVPVVDISPLLDLPELTDLYIVRVPARADVITLLKQRGVTVSPP